MSEPSEQPPITLLIADDHYITRVGLKSGLEMFADMKVIGEAANGLAAVDAATELKPHVVLMDLSMPGLDGIQAAKQIKGALPAVRILMLTTHDRDEDIFACFSTGADGYCLKDSLIESIAMAIRVINDGAAWLHPAIAKRVLATALQFPKASAELPERPKVTKFDRFALSARELEVLALLVTGLTNQQMAERLYLSIETVKTHMRHIMEKLQVSHRTEAAVKAVQEGLLTNH